MDSEYSAREMESSYVENKRELYAIILGSDQQLAHRVPSKAKIDLEHKGNELMTGRKLG